MSRPDEIDIERLTAALHDRGVRFVGPTPVRSRRPFLSDDSLLRGLAASPEPLHREALIALFLRRSGLAASLASALAGLQGRLTDPAFNYLASYRRMIELLVGQLKLERAHA